MTIRTIGKTQIIIFIVCLLTVVLGGIIGRQFIIDTLHHYKLLPQSEPVVELYFTDPDSLPDTYTPGQPLTVAFTVNNVTQATDAFQYVLTAQSEDGPATEIQRGTVTLHPDQSKNTDILFTPSDYGARVTFSLKLINNPQHINFWATRK